jgi:type II secretory pathway pseudopilin PulG
MLIVLAILSLLMALLLPAMARARQSAQLASCLNQLHQITLSTLMYADENEDALPFLPPGTTEYLDNYGFGGRYTTSSLPALSAIPLPQKRPLNVFMRPELRSNTSRVPIWKLRDPKRFNLPLFECPADQSFNYTERSREARRIPEYTQSAYFTTGTSYAFNIAWYGRNRVFRYSDFAEPFSWSVGIKFFERARYNYPNRFVVYIDEPGNFQSVFRLQPKETHHGLESSYSTSFLDGHAALVDIDRHQPFSSKHLLLFPEQERLGPGN